MNIVGNNIYFDNDDEFYEFCVIPELIILQYKGNDGSDRYYTDFNLSPQYQHAVNDGKRFIIKDEDSKIYRQKCLSYRTITKYINNLDPWFDGDEEE